MDKICCKDEERKMLSPSDIPFMRNYPCAGFFNALSVERSLLEAVQKVMEEDFSIIIVQRDVKLDFEQKKQIWK